MSLLEVIQWLCHDCSCETQLVPSAGVFSRCRRTNGGFNVGKRWRGRHLLSWRHRCGSTYGSPRRSSRGADSSLRSASTGLPCEPTLVILAGRRRSLLAAWSCRTTAAHCHGASWVWGTGLLSQLAPCPQPVAMKLWPHVLRDARCPRGELCSRGKCHCSCLFLARREMISHPCQSGSFLQHWISASLLNFLFKNPNLRQHSTWHLTLWLPWR